MKKAGALIYHCDRDGYEDQGTEYWTCGLRHHGDPISMPTINLGYEFFT